MEGRWPGLEEWQGTRGMDLGLPQTQAVGVGTTAAPATRLVCMLGSVGCMAGSCAV